MTNHEEERERCMEISRKRGDFEVGDDGYYYYWPANADGALAPYHLRWLADELDKMNAGWDKIVRDDLSRTVQE
jgi:hypothetical protein